ncbi:MAG: MarR family transcriptional regulator [Chloroflexi bacterium]|nr:MarR family transcriptional regulator [Chloroflexota bacterium]
MMISVTDGQGDWYHGRMDTARSVKPKEAGPSGTPTARIGYLLKHAQMRFQAIQQEALTPLGLEAAEHPPELQQRLGERLGIDRTTMVALIDKLEAAAFVERRSDPNDRRGHFVHVTSKGKKALAEGLEASAQVERAFLASLAPSERGSFRKMLERLI